MVYQSSSSSGEAGGYTTQLNRYVDRIEASYQQEVAQIERDLVAGVERQRRELEAEVQQQKRELREQVEDYVRQAKEAAGLTEQYGSGGPRRGSRVYTPSRSWSWDRSDGINWTPTPEELERGLFHYFVNNEMEISRFKEYVDQKRQAEREREDFRNFVENEMRIKKFKDYLD